MKKVHNIFCCRTSLLLVFIVFALQQSIAQEYIPASIDLDPGTTLEWNEDGSVKVTGSATFTSPIKKFLIKLINVTSDEMLLINSDDYLSKSYEIKNIGDISSTDPLNLTNKYQSVHHIMTDIQNYMNDPNHYINMSVNDFAQSNGASIRVYRRELMYLENNQNNTSASNFGFNLNTDEWVIYGGKAENANNVGYFRRPLENLTNFDGKPSGFSGISNYMSKDYARLFNKRHLGNKRWWVQEIYQDTNNILNFIEKVVAIYFAWEALSEVSVFEPGAEFVSDLEDMLITGFEKKELTVDIQTQNAIKQVAKNRAIATNKYTTSFNLQPVNVIKSSAIFSSAFLSNMALNNSDLTTPISSIGQFDQATFSYINVPNSTSYAEEPIGPVSSQVASEIFSYSRGGHTCKTAMYWDGFSNCIVQRKMPIVVELEVENSSVKEVSFPGLDKPLTPYQMFRNLKFTSSSDVEVDIVAGTTPLIKASSEHFAGTLQQELPKHFYYPIGTNVEYQLSFATENIDFNTFYLISELDINGIITILDNSNPSIFVKYVDHLGIYATQGTTLYNLYKIATTKNIVNLNLGTQTFLAGDTTTLLNHQEASNDVVINNDTNQAIFIDEEQNIQLDDAELTVNGDVLLYDVDDKENLDALIATENFQLYVGSVPVANAPLDEFGNPSRALGIVTENYVIEDRKQFLLPDFVFQADYKRMSLQDYELFVNKNKHLPFVPSQQEVDEQNYYSIPKMMMGQLQNLEEIILHAIDQQEKLEEHEQTQKHLKARLLHIEQQLNKLNKQH